MAVREMQTELGTRIVALDAGGSLMITNSESGEVFVEAHDGRSPPKRVPLKLTVREALTLIEFLAIAVKPGSGKQVFDMPEGLSLPEPTG